MIRIVGIPVLATVIGLRFGSKLAKYMIKSVILSKNMK